ncbi:primosomal protein N' [Lutibacter profundi]|uniref:Replication restart protein PriA n=1 Tax=Lutibacter profundi TaxID=1622118 RepID=A0A109RMX9_9FLAO|nr:primosomal protein N' [Lutibacter profundi]AMC10122.1 primosomal protein N' [Lutibacter profundi]
MNYFINVILPIPLQKLFTYKITEAEATFLSKGMRVAVEFGKSKVYTALVYKIHNEPPIGYEAKDIHQILDETPIVNEFQLKHWEWIANYYMCSLGEVYRAAMPSAFLLESETEIKLVQSFSNEEILSSDEFLIFEALQHQSRLSIQQIIEILGKKSIFPIIKRLIEKNVITVKEQIYEQYKPKLIKYIHLKEEWSTDSKLNDLLESLSRAKKQRDVVLTYFQLKATKKPIEVSQLQKKSNCSTAVIKSLIDKGVFEYYFIQTDRINFTGNSSEIKELTEHQQIAYTTIKENFKTKQTVLLKGITSSGKTEIYVKLIKALLKNNKQVLYLLPEIALTTQLIERLQYYFGEYLSVFHSKYSMNERVEVWNNVIANKQKAQLILGARSSLFLPFSSLELIIVDEEHEPSFKQYDPAPRYHARDASIVLAKMHSAKVLLGSATPSIESYYNAQQGKYGFVELNRRFGNVLLPEIELVNIKEKHRKKRMKGHFSDRLIEMITEAIENKEQVILFQNRRGYAPIVECDTCGVSPQCPQCDVSLTFHSYKKELRCHYCGYRQSMLHNCSACGSEKLNTKGFGTEQIEIELEELFPTAKIGRMDLDTTRGKYGYQKILGKFQAQEIDVLVGTQMLSKGLDFANVSLVGILNADNMLNFPDFRAHERSYQLMVQVSGRAGRVKKRGKVAIQTFNPFHQILQQVSTNSYEEMYKEQLDERWQYHYPPFFRLIKITLRHKDFNRVDEAANWLGKSLTAIFKENVLGPSIPSISRIRNYYIRTLIVKIPQKHSLIVTKKNILRVKNTFQAIKEFRSIRFNIDVDNY